MCSAKNIRIISNTDIQYFLNYNNVPEVLLKKTLKNIHFLVNKTMKD